MPAIAASAVYVLLMVAVAVGWGGVVLWVRLTAGGVALLIVLVFVLADRTPDPPRPPGHEFTPTRAEWRSHMVHAASCTLATVLGTTWQGDPALLVLAGVLGSTPYLALHWWEALRPNRTTPADQPSA